MAQRDGTKRRVQPQWFKEYDWLEYSATLNTLFCHTCRFYSHHDAVRSAFASENGFVNFNDGPSRLKPHQNSKRHQNATNFMVEYLRMKETDTSCASLENRHYMGAVWKSVRFCSLQGIGLRGHREDLRSIDKNPGNFLSLMSMLSEYDSVVKNRLNNSSSDKYTHHNIQNELITTAANIV